MVKRGADWPQPTRWLVGGVAAVVLGLAIAWVLVVPAADWLARHDVGSVKGPLLQTARDAARGRLLTLGAGLFAAGALLFTARNFILSRRTFELTEQSQVTDRYTKAIEQLGSEKADVRIGGIYALERIAYDSARDHPTVMEFLAAFIREHSREQWPPPATDEPLSDAPQGTPRPDVRSAISVIGRRDERHDRRFIDLTGACLAGACLADVNLTGANLTGADLTFATLTGANLTRANLFRTDLTTAFLIGATLTGAYLARAVLGRADLTGADLTGAELVHADLRAILRDADLTRANLRNAGLTGTSLRNANLVGANLTYANLTDADFTGADLTSADLTSAKFFRTNIARADLTGVKVLEDAPVPRGWVRDSSSGLLERANGDDDDLATNYFDLKNPGRSS